ncbi:MAG: hypothetical protein GEU81_07950, partial [Nitriliruptorales bacterium]|nr:hypothetical protein [Nitriliruptorales bacterium]
MTIPRPVLALMARRHGLITRGQLLARGCSVSDIDNWVHRGRLEALHRGVYRLAGAAVSPEQALLAAVLRAGTEARLAGEQALALYGIEGALLSGTPTVLVPPSRAVAGAEFVVRRSAVPAADRASVRGVPALRVERAVLEVARTAGDRRVRQAVDSARWLGLLRIERLTRRAERLGRHP